MTTTTTTTPGPAPTGPAPDPDRVADFAGEMLETLARGATALMVSIGHRTGLFDTIAGMAPASSHEIAAAAGLHERYVREWLGAMTVSHVVVHDRAADTYRLPVEHAALLTRAAGPDNLASQLQFIPMLAQVEEGIVRCFAEGGGLGYDAFARFDRLMAEQSAQTNDAALLDRIVPLVDGLDDRLRTGIRVADIGCGQGHALNLLAHAYPESDFHGYDFLPDAVAAARGEADAFGLGNVHVEVRDVADLSGTGTFGLITAFDAVHDQAYPARVLAQVAEHLDADGTFLMVDMDASSTVDDNIDVPWAPFLYTVSTMHCLTVSLAQGGEGLGTVWGRQTAQRMLADAGFSDVSVASVPDDFVNAYYVARH
ncbi:class I SAM-dependent methyltransferase [Isoptericola sediminis]|uniref:Class I SAM-dependent methyltransferase n=1 Tax=Isoptericola sediminis TaxID=2733572 RepID=A0A849JTJ7_9MICO|nr:methyltransferase domain-containing protein [Isoptericola sediminis]NNU26622.1 class I SAM-dependent methyltransferase [Isoptericola sediminis]